MIYITIDEMQGEIQQEIEQMTGLKSFIKGADDQIPYDEIEMMITYGLKEDWIHLNEMTNLKWIQVFQTGIEHVPLEAIKSRGIPMTNVRNIYGEPISEYVMSIILYEIKHLERFIENKRMKKYDRSILTDEARHKTIGIFGTGNVGKKVAAKAQAFHMNVLGFNSNGRAVKYFDQVFSWSEKRVMLQQCDFIILLLPLTSDTRNFLDEEDFSIMKKDVYIINVGRGPLINEHALLHALHHQKIKGAALDVFKEEPLPASSPLWETEGLLLTPHLSGKTRYFFNRCLKIFARNYQSYRNGETMEHLIDFDKGY